MPPFFSFQVQFQGMSILGGSSLKYCLFSPLREMIQFNQHICQYGLVQPPTRLLFTVHGFIRPRWLFGMYSINSKTGGYLGRPGLGAWQPGQIFFVFFLCFGPAQPWVPSPTRQPASCGLPDIGLVTRSQGCSAFMNHQDVHGMEVVRINDERKDQWVQTHSPTYK